jgi:hypothetical protein
VQRWFRREAVEELIKAHEARTFDHSARLWALLMLELWLQEWGSQEKSIALTTASSGLTTASLD